MPILDKLLQGGQFGGKFGGNKQFRNVREEYDWRQANGFNDGPFEQYAAMPALARPDTERRYLDDPPPGGATSGGGAYPALKPDRGLAAPTTWRPSSALSPASVAPATAAGTGAAPTLPRPQSFTDAFSQVDAQSMVSPQEGETPAMRAVRQALSTLLGQNADEGAVLTRLGGRRDDMNAARGAIRRLLGSPEYRQRVPLRDLELQSTLNNQLQSIDPEWWL